MSIGKVTAVNVIGASSLSLAWDDGQRRMVDLSREIERNAALAPIGNAHAFAQVRISEDGWSIEWPGGIDFGAPQLRRWAEEQAGDAMPSRDFTRWVERHGLNASEAGKALGLPAGLIEAYLSGESAVPKTVMLATEGFDRRLAA